MIRLEDVTFTVNFEPYGTFSVKPCKKYVYDYIVSVLNANDKIGIIEGVKKIVDLPCNVPIIGACRVFLLNYVTAIQEYCKAHYEKYAIPEHLDVPGSSEEEEKKEPLRFPIYTYGEGMVRDYTGYDFDKIQNLSVLEYKFYEAEAYKISVLKRVDGTGTQFLNECFDYMNEMSKFNIEDLLD